MEEKISEKIHLLDIQITKTSNNTFPTSMYIKENFISHFITGIRFAPQNKIEDHTMHYQQSY